MPCISLLALMFVMLSEKNNTSPCSNGLGSGTCHALLITHTPLFSPRL